MPPRTAGTWTVVSTSAAPMAEYRALEKTWTPIETQRQRREHEDHDDPHDPDAPPLDPARDGARLAALWRRRRQCAARSPGGGPGSRRAGADLTPASVGDAWRRSAAVGDLAGRRRRSSACSAPRSCRAVRRPGRRDDGARSECGPRRRAVLPIGRRAARVARGAPRRRSPNGSRAEPAPGPGRARGAGARRVPGPSVCGSRAAVAGRRRRAPVVAVVDGVETLTWLRSVTLLGATRPWRWDCDTTLDGSESLATRCSRSWCCPSTAVSCPCNRVRRTCPGSCTRWPPPP